MLAPLDIFKMQNGTYVWKAAAESFEVAKSKVEQMARIAPGEYMIFSQTTQNKTLILDGAPKRIAKEKSKSWARHQEASVTAWWELDFRTVFCRIAAR